MSHMFKRVIVLLNDFEKIDILLKKAIEFASQGQISLEILYVQEEPLFALPDYFISDDKVEEDIVDKEKIKREIQKHLSKFDSIEKHSILVFIDDTIDRLLVYAKNRKDILVVSSYHKDITPSLLKKTSYTYWIIKDESQEYKKSVLPIDLKDNSRESIQMAQDIFKEADLTLVHDYRYILDTLAIREDYLNVVPLTTTVDFELNRQIKIEQQKVFESYKKEFSLSGDFIEGDGTLDADLIEFIKNGEFDVTILYHHDEELFFSPTLILTLLDQLSCDFFIF